MPWNDTTEGLSVGDIIELGEWTSYRITAYSCDDTSQSYHYEVMEVENASQVRIVRISNESGAGINGTFNMTFRNNTWYWRISAPIKSIQCICGEPHG